MSCDDTCYTLHILSILPFFHSSFFHSSILPFCLPFLPQYTMSMLSFPFLSPSNDQERPLRTILLVVHAKSLGAKGLGATSSLDLEQLATRAGRLGRAVAPSMLFYECASNLHLVSSCYGPAACFWSITIASICLLRLRCHEPP